MDTSASGRNTSTVPNKLRNVSRHMRMTAANTQPRMGYSLASTSSLVAAITPTLPVARLKLALANGLSVRHCLTSLTTRSIVAALWSRRNIITGTTLQSAFSSPVLVSM